MLFSILIANYNNGHFFNDCYQSILSQNYTDWEVIIVDDCSTDDSVVVIQEMIKYDSRFFLYENDTNKGCGYTKRRCAEFASGEICAYLDPDDTLENDTLRFMVDAHEKCPNVAVITSKYYNVDLNLNKISIANHGELIPEGYSYLTFGKGALTHFATFKSVFYAKTSGINPKFKRAVDQDLYYRLEEVGGHFFIDKPLYNYRINPNSISVNQNIYKARYWHFLAMKDAFLRRKRDGGLIHNFTDNEFKRIEYNYFKSRIKIAAEKRKMSSKYYFLFKIIIIDFNYQLKYKVKCFLFPLYA